MLFIASAIVFLELFGDSQAFFRHLRHYASSAFAADDYAFSSLRLIFSFRFRRAAAAADDADMPARALHCRFRYHDFRY